METWQINIKKIVNDIKSAAVSSHTEEDLKMRIEPIFRNVLKKIGVNVDNVQYEKTSINYRGRQDAVYGFLTIEYKRPGKLSQITDINNVKIQLQKYLSNQASQYGRQKEEFLEKAIGVAIDGKSILFIRFSKTPVISQTPVPVGDSQKSLFPELEKKQGFYIQGPYPISSASINNLLIFFRASSRLPLTADNLSSHFSPDCPVTQRIIIELYSAITKAWERKNQRIKTFFHEWDKIFGIVYGQELEKAEEVAEQTGHIYQISGGTNLKHLLFSIHTFYAFLMKLLAIELISMQRESTIESFIKDLPLLDDEKFKERLTYLEGGADFKNYGIENFLEADFFGWYLNAWKPRLINAIRNVIRTLSEFEPATPILEPEWTKDLLQKLYELIVPIELRHSLGEYYTPDWLASYVVDKSGYNGKSGVRLLDPACGSGTFIIQAINKVIQSNKIKKKEDIQKVGKHILNNIVGFDLNPVAVITARTNYLIAFSRFIPYVRPINIPIYLCDSVLGPFHESDKIKFQLIKDTLIFTTTKGDYVFPVSMKKKPNIDKFTSMIDVSLKSNISPDSFESQIKKEFKLSDYDNDLLLKIYKKIRDLDKNGENGIWAKYIKNAFAPTYLDKFDYVIGNPPWIRWDYLSDEYRKSTLKLWKKYGLFSLKGHEARLGGGKKDFSMLFTYVAVDKYLKQHGKLGFVITIEVFKSKGAGEGFRHFNIKYNDTPFKILSMEDMVHVKPFTAANKTSVFFLKKGEKTSYPVPVLEWKRKKGVGSIKPEWDFNKVKDSCEIKEFSAIPIDNKKEFSSWQTAFKQKLNVFKNLKGENSYKAYTGAFTTPYGIFWLNVKEVRPDNILVVNNLYDRGKWKIKPVTTSLESELIYPGISGKEILKFGLTSYFYLLITQNPKIRKGYDEEFLKIHLPLTYAYLIQFKDILEKRASYKKFFCKVIKRENNKEEIVPIAPFYSQYDIAEYTFAKYKVVWKQMGTDIQAVVLHNIKTGFGIKSIIPIHTIGLISLNNKDEAHYICSILNSDIINDFIKSFSQAGRGFGSPSIMENLAIPKFENKNKLHIYLSQLSEKAHLLVKENKSIDSIQEEINKAVKQLWNIKS